MAHDICMVTGEAAVAFDQREGTPWHGLGLAHDGPMTPLGALELARLDYRVEAVPAFAQVGSAMVGADDHRAIVRSDCGRVLGMVGSGYTVIQNRDTAEAIERVYGGPHAVVSVAGALGQGERIWFLCGLGGEAFEVQPGDPIERYLLVTSAHDGSGAHRMLFTSVRVVCRNTLTIALRGAQHQVSLRHTRNVGLALPMLADVLAQSRTYWERVREAFAMLARQSVTRPEVRSFLDQLLPAPRDARGEIRQGAGLTKIEAQRETIRRLFEGGGDGSALAGSTRWGLLNAATQWIDRERPIKGATDRRLGSLLHEGTAADLRQRAFELLTQPSLA